MNSVMHTYSNSLTLVLNGDGAEEGDQNNEMDMAKLHLLPILNSRMDQNFQNHGVREVRVHCCVFWKKLETSLLFFPYLFLLLWRSMELEPLYFDLQEC